MTNKTKKRNPKQYPKPTSFALLHACGIGTALGTAILLIMAVLLSFAVLKSETPANVIRPAAMICLFACGYGGALAGAKKAVASEYNPHLGGLCVFGALAAIVLLVSLFVKNAEGASALQHFLPLCVLAAACALGSLTAAWHRPSQKRQLKKLLRK